MGRRAARAAAAPLLFEGSRAVAAARLHHTAAQARPELETAASRFPILHTIYVCSLSVSVSVSAYFTCEYKWANPCTNPCSVVECWVNRWLPVVRDYKRCVEVLRGHVSLPLPAGRAAQWRGGDACSAERRHQHRLIGLSSFVLMTLFHLWDLPGDVLAAPESASGLDRCNLSLSLSA